MVGQRSVLGSVFAVLPGRVRGVPEVVFLKDLRLEDADEREVAVTLLVIQTIPDHEGIRDVEAGVFDR
jgi:hypothetical protein